MHYFKESGMQYTYDGKNGLRVSMDIDVAILEELARAGMGRDFSDVIDTALRLSRLLASYKDENGDVFIRSKQEISSTELVAVHAFENTFGGSKRLPRAADEA